jgi:hypothetical protein
VDIIRTLISKVRLPEVEQIYRVLDLAGPLFHCEVLAEVPVADSRTYPILGIRVGPDDPNLPTLGLFGGVHGLERVGSHVVLAYLHTLAQALRWDRHERARFERLRVVTIPVVNPGGMANYQRSNPNKVDLMRNAPVDADAVPLHLMGGQRVSSMLPWYRGRKDDPLELEAQTLIDFVEREMFSAPTALSLDLHSGFGWRDQLWYPYARTRGRFPRGRSAERIGQLLEETYPNHVYVVEPQSENYIVHGDLWDYTFDKHVARHGLDGPVFIPWTLEMGSWAWLRKNPRQLLSLSGPFNPMTPKRLARVLRRHLSLMDFLLRAVDNAEAWVDTRDAMFAAPQPAGTVTPIRST